MDLGPFHLEVVKHLSTAAVAQQGVACRRHLPRLWLGLLTRLSRSERGAGTQGGSQLPYEKGLSG